MRIKPGLNRRHFNRNTVKGVYQHRGQLTDTVLISGNGRDVKCGSKKLGQVGVSGIRNLTCACFLGKGIRYC